MDKIKPIAELIYLLSGPVVAIIAYLALGQIRIAKEQLIEQKKSTIINSKRDALKLTSEQISHFGTKVIPLINTLNDAIEVHNIRLFFDAKIEIDNNEISVDTTNIPDESDKLILIGQELTSVMNAIEGFSAYFATGVADEKLAYYSVSSTFCHTIKKLLPILLPITEDDLHFSATMHLFNIWHTRKSTEKLLLEKSKIEKKLSGKNVLEIKPIGTA